ncbi:MAG: oxygenase MpaB family protein [Crocinitomicaceae bacterium]|nr:oxygenase MpaB family protein [Crocinitomicaceae bacterium]
MLSKNQHIEYFWFKGNGKDLLNWSNTSEEKLKKEIPAELFHQVDDAVDELVKEWIAEKSFGNIMAYLHGKGEYDLLPKSFKDFHSKNSKVPDWVDFKLIESGTYLSQRAGLNALLTLRNFSLLGGYFFSNLTKPLVETGALEKGATLRLFYTLGFWVNVSRSDAESQTLRLNSCMQVRLVHSASRLMIKKKNPSWDYENLGEPINYADMIATYTAFTVYLLYGLNKLKFKFSKEEEDGIFHLWKYVTWLLGIPLDVIPNNRLETLSFFYNWSLRQNTGDIDSARLANALIEENTAAKLLKSDFIKRNMGYIHKSIAHYFLDDQILELLQIPTVKFQFIIPAAMKFKNLISANSEKQRMQGDIDQRSILEDYRKANEN